MARNIVLWVIIALVMMIIFQSFSPQRTSNSSISYSDFVSAVKSGRVSTVKIDGTQIEVQMHDGSRMFTFSPETDNGPLIGSLLDNQVRIEAIPPERQSLLTQIFISWFPFLLLIGVWIYVMRQMQGGGGGRGALSFVHKQHRAGRVDASHLPREAGSCICISFAREKRHEGCVALTSESKRPLVVQPRRHAATTECEPRTHLFIL